jgi:hypothetical protein
MARLYADEDFPFPVVERLRQLGHDVQTTLEAGRANQGIDDAQQLDFATGLGRATLTRNRRDFAALHRKSARHAGIVSITDDPDFAGQAQRVHDALMASPNPAGQHLRVNRPNPSLRP